MEELFIPEEESLELRKLGYDDLCLARFYGGGFKLLPTYDPLRNSEIKEHWFSVAPLWEQVFHWFREEHNLHGFMENSCVQDSNEYNIFINYTKVSEIGLNSKRAFNLFGYKTYKEAQLACLRKLIEIIRK